ncbi:MAG: rhodanese-like domain-containing protein, partial [Pseudomonadota bacterium]
KCHPEYEKQAALFAGQLVGVSQKAKTICLKMDGENEVVFYDDATVLKNAPAMKDIPKDESVRIAYVKKDGKRFATLVEVKKGIEVPKEKLASAEDVAKLTALGPEKGNYVLIDSRPAEMYHGGYIPTAKNMPFFAFDGLVDKVLPKNKDTLQIYYCAGFS